MEDELKFALYKLAEQAAQIHEEKISYLNFHNQFAVLFIRELEMDHLIVCSSKTGGLIMETGLIEVIDRDKFVCEVEDNLEFLFEKAIIPIVLKNRDAILEEFNSLSERYDPPMDSRS